VATRSANLGRWFSPDPKLSCGNNPQGLNLYAYVVDNPINLVDPAGLQACDPWDPFCPGFAPSDPCSDPWYAVSHAECPSWPGRSPSCDGYCMGPLPPRRPAVQVDVGLPMRVTFRFVMRATVHLCYYEACEKFPEGDIRAACNSIILARAGLPYFLCPNGFTATVVPMVLRISVPWTDYEADLQSCRIVWGPPIIYHKKDPCPHRRM
jgi:hypothetical protein